MVIWGGSRPSTAGRPAAARHILTWADICPARRHRRRLCRVFTEANCYPPTHPPFLPSLAALGGPWRSGHQSRSGVHYPFSTDGARVMDGPRDPGGEGAFFDVSGKKGTQKRIFSKNSEGNDEVFTKPAASGAAGAARCYLSKVINRGRRESGEGGTKKG